VLRSKKGKDFSFLPQENVIRRAGWDCSLFFPKYFKQESRQINHTGTHEP
jgi:hypothetical protein